MMGLASAIIYIFGTVAPVVSIRLIGMAPDRFGLWNILPSLGLVAGTILASYLSSRQTTLNTLLYGILLMLLGAAAIGFSFSQGWILALSLFVPMFFIQTGDNLFWVNASASGLSHATDKSNASAVMQFINIGIASIGTFISMNFSPRKPMVLPIALGITVVLMLPIWFLLFKYQKKQKALEKI
jgi:predicted MFS family arabinose efflux permease